MHLRETMHVRRRRADEVIDEADALGQAQYAVGEAIADEARDLRDVAQFDQPVQQACHSGAGHAGLFRQHGDGAVRAPAQRLEDLKAAADGLDGHGCDVIP